MNFGTEIWTAGFTQVFQHFAKDNGGGTPLTLGTNAGGISGAGVMDADLVYMKGATAGVLGDAMGKITGGIPVFWAEGPPSTTPSAPDHQFTVAELKACKGTYKFFKDPPGGKKVYKEVVDMSGCPPDTLFGVWNVFSNTALQSDRKVSTPAGGLPEGIIINGAGKGHFERDLDPNLWFKSGVAINGVAHGSTVAVPVPDLTNFPNATVSPHIIYQNLGQSNGNPGFCEFTPVTPCTACNSGGTCTAGGGTCACSTPPSSKVFLPGRNGVTSAVSHFAWQPATGMESYCSVSAGNMCKPIPLSMLQPY